jgi:glutathione S-transferase
MMHVELFGSRLSPFVEKCVRALQLKDIPFQLVPPRSRTDFKRWNPQTKKMPVLDIDGVRTFDSSWILRRLDELVPAPALFDIDPSTAARQRFLEDWSDEALFWYGVGLRWADANASATIAQTVNDIGAPRALRPIIGMVLRWQNRSQAVGQGLQRLPTKLLVEELARRLDELHVWLGERPFFFANQPSAADLALFGQLRMLQSGSAPQAAELIANRLWLCDYYDRVDRATSGPTSR